MKMKFLLLTVLFAFGVQNVSPKPKVYMDNLVSGLWQTELSWVSDDEMFAHALVLLHNELNSNEFSLKKALTFGDLTEDEKADCQELLKSAFELNYQCVALSDYLAQFKKAFIIFDYNTSKYYVLSNSFRAILDHRVHISDKFGAGQGRLFCLQLFDKQERKTIKELLKEIDYDKVMGKLISARVNGCSSGKINGLVEKVASAERRALSISDIWNLENKFRTKNIFNGLIRDSQGMFDLSDDEN